MIERLVPGTTTAALGSISPRALRAVMCFVVLIVPAATAQPEEPKNYALLIGISDYDPRGGLTGIVDLDFADNDARALHSVLRRAGYDVGAPLIDRDARKEFIVTEFGRLRREIRKQDTFLLFFAGHGVRDSSNGKAYWLTYDARLEDLDNTSIRLDHLLDFVRDIKAERKLVLLDHCYSGDVEYAGIAESIEPAAASQPQIESGDQAGSEADSTEEPADRSLPSPPLATSTVTLEGRALFAVEQVRSQIDDESHGLVVVAAARNAAFESSQYGQGLFTKAVLTALDTRKADKSPSDGKLSANELISFLGPEVQALAAGLGQAQDVIDVVSATKLSSWIISSELPPEGSEAVRRRDGYLAHMREWKNNPGINFPPVVYLKCRETLNAWVASVEQQQPLGPRHEKILSVILDYIVHVDEIEDRAIAESIRDEIGGLGND